MENIVSKKGYRVSFIIINLFVALFVSMGVAATIINFLTPSRLALGVIIIVIFMAWVILAVMIAKRVWPDQKIVVPEIVSKQVVAKYRTMVYSFICVIILAIVVVPLGRYGMVSDTFLTIAVNVLFWIGLLGLCTTMFYFSGSKNVSANQILLYPFQFIEDRREKTVLTHKKIKWYWIHTCIAASIVILYGIIFQRDLIAIIGILVTLSGGSMYRSAQLKKLL